LFDVFEWFKQFLKLILFKRKITSVTKSDLSKRLQSLSNKRYRRCGVITGEVNDELSAEFADYPILKQVDKLIDDKVFRLVSLSRQVYFPERTGISGTICSTLSGEQAT